MKIFDPKLTGSIEILNTITGDVTLAGNLNVEGGLGGAVTGSATASYVDFDNIDNKPTLLSGSAQIASDISGSFINLSSSLEGRVSDQESFSSSLDATFATDADLNLVSSSVDSLNAATSSYALENNISGSSTSLSSSLASELLKNTTDTLTGDLTVTGTLTAQDLHVQEVTSSIVFSSGSNKFGALSTDTQKFTGSLEVNGSSHYLLGDVGIGTAGPETALHLYTNDTSTKQLMIDQGSTGDAVMSFRLAGVSEYVMGIDNSDSDKFKIANSGTVSTSTVLTIDSSGNVGIGGNLSVMGTSKFIEIGSANTGTNFGFIGWNAGSKYLFIGNSYNSAYNENLVIDSSGRVGIGITPFSWSTSFDNIQIGNKISLWNASNNGGLSYNQYYNGTNNIYQTNDTANRFQMDADGFHFYQAASGTAGTSATFSESMRIDSSGNSTFAGNVTTQGGLNITGTNNTTSTLTLTNTASTPDNSWSLTPQYNSQDLHLLEDTTTQVTFKSGGNVGIGTTSPSTKLHLGGTAPLDSIIRQDSTVSGTNWEIGERAAGKWQIWEDDGDSVVATFMSTGNVGIGRTDPNARLDIKGAGASTGLTFETSDASNNQTFYIQDGGRVGVRYYPFVIGADSSTTVSGLYNKLAVYNLSTRVVSVNYQDSINTIMSHAGAPNYGLEALTIRGDYIAFYTDYDPSHYQGVERMRIDSSGNVFINGQTDNILGVNTSDGSDNKSITITSSAVASSNRGGYASFYGNEHATFAGNTFVVAGNTSGAELRLHAVNSSGIITAYTAGSERMRIDSEGLVVLKSMGVNTTRNLVFEGDSNSTSGNAGAIGMFADGARLTSNYYYSGGQAKYVSGNGQAQINLQTGTTAAGTFMSFGVNPPVDAAGVTERMRIDSSGNVGIGVTPFVSSLPNTVIDIKPVASIWGYGNSVYLNSNAYYNSGWLYKSTAAAGVLQVEGDLLRFRAAASGTANAGVAFDVPFIVDSGGNVGIGVTDPQAKLEVKGPSATPADGNEVISVTNTTGNSKLLLGVVENSYGWIQSAEGSTYRDLLLNPLGGNIGIGTTTPLGGMHVKGNPIVVDDGYQNHQTMIYTSGQSGTYNGSFTFETPETGNGASSVGYGGYVCEIYISGYDGKYCHAIFSGYINVGISAGEATILRSSGGWSISQGVASGTFQGLSFVLDYPSGLTHPCARISFTKGGDNANEGYDFTNVTTSWS